MVWLNSHPLPEGWGGGRGKGLAITSSELRTEIQTKYQGKSDSQIGTYSQINTQSGVTEGRSLQSDFIYDFGRIVPHSFL